MNRLLLVVLAGLLPVACAHAPVQLGGAEELRTEEGRFQLEYEPSDAPAAAQVRRAVLAAAPRLARWGRLRDPVAVRVLPTHRDLERAAGEDYDWLRAWARYAEVDVQSPASWFDDGAAVSQDRLDELLLHELTHALMYQLAARADDWQRKGIPVWFREGLASVTAQQTYRRCPLPQLRQWLLHEGRLPLDGEGTDLSVDNSAAYGTAHHAFAYLLRRIGDEGVKQILAEMAGGKEFEAAFLGATGTAPAAFARDFEAYVVDEAWLRDGAGPRRAPTGTSVPAASGPR